MPIRVHFGFDAVLGFLLTLVRVGSTLMLLPLPAFKEAVHMARIVIVIAITFALMPSWPSVHLASLSVSQFALAVMSEMAAGLILGLGIGFLHQSFQLAAQIISMQAGFSFASTFDPTSQADTTVFQMLAQLTTGLLFFILGIHQQLIRLLARSFAVFSRGDTVLNSASTRILITMGSDMFALGFRLGLPVVTLLLLVEIALALLSRLHAQLPLINLTLSAKTILSFAFFAAILIRWPTLYEHAAHQIFDSLSHLGLS